MTDPASSGSAPTGPPADRDYAALTAPVSRTEVAEFRRASRAAGRFSGGTAATAITVVVGVVVLIVFLGVGSTVVSVFSSVAGIPGGPTWVVPVVALVVVGLLIALVVFAVSRITTGTWARRLRLARFADANGLGYSSGDRNPAYPGAIFGIGGSRTTGDHLFSIAGRPIDLGSYSYQTGSGDDRTTHRWGFIAMRLDRNLPNMVLDARRNNGLFGGSNLPGGYRRDQVLSLEGDFDRHFTLYCPREYERDALYVFTPDLMALLIDNVATYDVEIVDQWLFVYSATPFDLDDPTTVQRLFRIVDTVGAKTLDRTERYSDDRAGSRAAAGFFPGVGSTGDPGTVAPGGRRLRRRWGLTGVVFVVLLIVFQVARFWIETR